MMFSALSNRKHNSVKCQTVIILGSVGHMVSARTNKLCSSTVKAATGKREMNVSFCLY